MEKNKSGFTPSAELYRTIIDRVVEDFDSPYNQLMRKTNDIDVDYFDGLRSSSSVLDEKLNDELKSKVLGDFEKQADELLTGSRLREELLDEVKHRVAVVKENMGEEACGNYLDGLSSELKNYSFDMEIEPRLPDCTDSDLQEKFEAAKRITLKERIMGNNIYDVVDYHNALMNRTWWESRVLVTDRVSAFLIELSKEIRKLKD